MRMFFYCNFKQLELELTKSLNKMKIIVAGQFITLVYKSKDFQGLYIGTVKNNFFNNQIYLFYIIFLSGFYKSNRYIIFFNRRNVSNLRKSS